jgi:hypothetical protein
LKAGLDEVCGGKRDVVGGSVILDFELAGL